ncbi:hypothetical protein [Lentzea sp. CA-135723]|uniref:hypothetical protein n=1 Tax=Lentzea sp. CA-135723 TaxID=3239950 RepID=UPI003D9490EA
MRIEDELRGALDVPAPPQVTTLETVLARGRRKVAVRRAAITGSTLALVAVVAVGVIAWPFGTSRGTDPVNWARATPAPGRTADPPRQDSACERGEPRIGVATFGDALSAEDMRSWWTSTQSVLPGRKVSAKHPEQAEAESTRVYAVDIAATSMVLFSTERFDGSPAAAADKAFWLTGECAPPRRTTRDDGTVFQLYGPASFAQTLVVFRAGGRTFRLDQVNNGSSGDGLPMTEDELVRLGAAVAEVS